MTPKALALAQSTWAHVMLANDQEALHMSQECRKSAAVLATTVSPEQIQQTLNE